MTQQICINKNRKACIKIIYLNPKCQVVSSL